MVVVVKVESEAATDMIRGLSVTIPKATAKGTFNVARRSAKDLRESAKAAGIRPFRGKLLSKAGIRAEKISKFVYYVKMPYYGSYLDAMKTHYVALRRGRLITKWAQKYLGRTTGGVIVSAHPFIQTAFLKTARSAKKIIERELNRTIRKKGRGSR